MTALAHTSYLLCIVIHESRTPDRRFGVSEAYTHGEKNLRNELDHAIVWLGWKSFIQLNLFPMNCRPVTISTTQFDWGGWFGNKAEVHSSIFFACLTNRLRIFCSIDQRSSAFCWHGYTPFSLFLFFSILFRLFLISFYAFPWFSTRNSPFVKCVSIPKNHLNIFQISAFSEHFTIIF